MTKWSGYVVGLCVLLVSASAWAHKPSDSYLSFEGSAGRLDARWDIALRDLDAAMGLDTNGDGKVEWGELKAADAMVKAYAADALELRTPGGACSETFGETQVVSHSDGAYAALRLELRCPDEAASPKLHYGLLFEIDAQHRAIVTTGSGAPIVLTKQQPDAQLGLAATGLRGFAAIVKLGVQHILEGYDHLLFLLALLLPAVLRREGKRWIAARDFKGVLGDVLRIVTAFTVAHSITLAVAAVGWVSLPARFVESAIALSVVLAALNNLWPVVRSERWLAAFGLGLLHGFGFAAALADIGLSPATFARTVFGFNLGVELGQLGVVLLLLPLLHRLRRSTGYQAWGLRAGSACVVAIACVWLVERVFDLQLVS